MAGRLAGKVVVITGASSGIGRATALAFARRGASVVLAARREQALRDLAAECQRLGGQAMAVPTDVTLREDVQRLAMAATTQFGRIDLWFNNAAVALYGRLEEVPYEAWRRVVDVNLMGYVHGARSAMALFREQGFGILVNNASVAAKTPQPFASAYVASKFAIRGFSESLRQETLGSDIHVCTVLPAFIDTPLFQQAGNYVGRAVRPMKPIVPAERVAEVVVGLATRPRREVLVGGAGRMLTWFRALAPRWAERSMARAMEVEHFTEAPVAHSPGNLFEPSARWTSVSGGWIEPRSARRVAGLAALFLLPVAWTLRALSRSPGAARLAASALARARGLPVRQVWEERTLPALRSIAARA